MPTIPVSHSLNPKGPHGSTSLTVLAFLGIPTADSVPSKVPPSFRHPTPKGSSFVQLSLLRIVLGQGHLLHAFVDDNMLGITAASKAPINAHPGHRSHDYRVTPCSIIESTFCDDCRNHSEPIFDTYTRIVPRGRPRADRFTLPNVIVSTLAPQPSVERPTHWIGSAASNRYRTGGASTIFGYSLASLVCQTSRSRSRSR